MYELNLHATYSGSSITYKMCLLNYELNFSILKLDYLILATIALHIHLLLLLLFITNVHVCMYVCMYLFIVNLL